MLEHETKHHDQFKEYYADPLRHAIDKLNVSYHYEYCSLAFDLSDAQAFLDRAQADAIFTHNQRYARVTDLFESWSSYKAAANELDVSDYALIDSAMPTNLRIRD